MIIQKKSQAALEFLTTYAWALVLIAIIIGAIAYLGVTRPQQILPDRCTFNVGFGCQAFKIGAEILGADGTFDLQLKNQLGEIIDVSSITLMEEDETAITCTTPPANPTAWKVGGFQTLSWTGCTFPTTYIAGQKAKILIEINFYNTAAGSVFTRTAAGDILTTVQ